MTRLEQVILPFAGEVSTPGKQGTLNLPQLQAPVIFRVRATGGQIKQGHGKQQYTFYAIKHHREKVSPDGGGGEGGGGGGGVGGSGRQEDSRDTHMIRVYNPLDSSNFVDIKAIDRIHFIAQMDQYWDYQYDLANAYGRAGDDTARTVRVQRVMGSDDESYVDVERVQVAEYTHEEEQYWQNNWDMQGNKASDEPEPEHYKTHLVKITGYSGADPTDADPDPGLADLGTWVIVQRMDTLDSISQQEQYWEGQYELRWPPSTTAGEPPPNEWNGFIGGDVLSKDDGTGQTDDNVDPDSVVDSSYNPDDWGPALPPGTGVGVGVLAVEGGQPQPAYRFDPFQNIVDVQWGGLAVEFFPHNT